MPRVEVKQPDGTWRWEEKPYGWSPEQTAAPANNSGGGGSPAPQPSAPQPSQSQQWDFWVRQPNPGETSGQYVNALTSNGVPAEVAWQIFGGVRQSGNIAGYRVHVGSPPVSTVNSGGVTGGGTVAPANTGGSAPGGGGANNLGDFSPQDYLDYTKLTSGFSIKELEEKKRQFDTELAFEREKMERLGLPELAIKQRLADLQERQFQATLAQTAASFAASDPFALSDDMRGIGAMGQSQVPYFIQALSQGQSPQVMQAPTGAPPAAATMNDFYNLTSGAPLANQTAAAGTTTSAPGYNTDATLASVQQVLQRGAGALPVGSLERLDQNEMGLLQAGIKRTAGEAAVPAFLRQYQKSRPQQSASRGTSLAY